jgi:hypothetical protein
MSDVQAQDIDWLWEKYIPFRAVTILDGDPGEGKSTISIDIAARVSKGLPMPTGPQEPREPAGVLLLSAEDDLARTIRPRLDEAGADTSRVFALDAVRTGGDERPPVLPWDLLLVENLILMNGIRLVVIDPLMAYMDAKINAHSDQDVRRAMHRLKILADKTGAAVLVLRHLNKLNGGPALYRGGGSIGIIGAARSGLLVGRDPNDPTKHVLASNKSNLGPPPKSLYYALVASGKVSVIGWGEVCDLTNDDILGVPGSRQRRSVLEQCCELLAELLKDGQKAETEIKETVLQHGHKERTYYAARKKLKVRSAKSSEDGKWYLSLPPEAVEPPEDPEVDY